MNYHQVNDTFVEIEKDLVYAIIDKCGGNPLLCVSVMHQLLLVRKKINNFILCIERLSGDQRTNNSVQH